MKTWEMIKEITENPDKRFKIKNGKATVGISDSRLQWLDDEDVEAEFVLTELILHDMEWEEVEEPVDFTIAFNSLQKDKSEIIQIVMIPWKPLAIDGTIEAEFEEGGMINVNR